MPPLIAKHLADALQEDMALVAYLWRRPPDNSKTRGVSAHSPERPRTGQRSGPTYGAKRSGLYPSPYLSLRC
jgi:hypothetical protein